MAHSGYQEVETFKATLPVGMALSMGGFVTLIDAGQHLWRGLGLGSSFVGTADTVVGMVNALSPFQIFWGIVMLLVAITLISMARKTKE